MAFRRGVVCYHISYNSIYLYVFQCQKCVVKLKVNKALTYDTNMRRTLTMFFSFFPPKCNQKEG